MTKTKPTQKTVYKVIPELHPSITPELYERLLKYYPSHADFICVLMTTQDKRVLEPYATLHKLYPKDYPLTLDEKRLYALSYLIKALGKPLRYIGFMGHSSFWCCNAGENEIRVFCMHDNGTWQVDTLQKVLARGRYIMDV